MREAPRHPVRGEARHPEALQLFDSYRPKDPDVAEFSCLPKDPGVVRLYIDNVGLLRRMSVAGARPQDDTSSRSMP